MGVSLGPPFPFDREGKGAGRWKRWAEKRCSCVLLDYIVFSEPQRETNEKVVSLQELQVISVLLMYIAPNSVLHLT